MIDCCDDIWQLNHESLPFGSFFNFIGTSELLAGIFKYLNKDVGNAYCIFSPTLFVSFSLWDIVGPGLIMNAKVFFLFKMLQAAFMEELHFVLYASHLK